MNYSPFSNVKNIIEISSLQYSDLQVLSSLTESYSIEYKSEFNDRFKAEKLPKTISAFANSNGGWLFIGVDNNGNVQDVDLTGVREEDIYSIIGSRVSPIPIIHVAILYKDSYRNTGVIVVYTEEGKNTPYVSNGTIYVRNGKESKPAERSTIDLLLKKGMEHSNLSLRCFDNKENSFSFYNKFDSSLPRNSIYHIFMSCFDECGRVALYIENQGNHFDENIDLTIKVPILFKVDLLSELLKLPNLDYEKCFESFKALPSTPEILTYQRSGFHPFPVPPIQSPSFPYGQQAPNEYHNKCMEYLVDCYNHDMEVFVEGKYLYYKISFNAINAGQKMFLPVVLIFRNGITEIEYYFTSKYSMGIIEGKLIKKVATEV